MTIRLSTFAAIMLTTACYAADRSPALPAVFRRAPPELEIRWKAMRELGRLPDVQIPSDSTAIQDAIMLGADTGAMLGDDPLLLQSYWNVIDQMLRTAKATDLIPVRELQESKAAALAREISRKGEIDEAVRLFRRYPWARSAQELLIEFAENALRDGRLNWAARSFQDVLLHANDPLVLAQARVGSWLALAGFSDWHGDLASSMSTVPDDTMLPWQGGMAKALEIKASILARARQQDATAPPPLSSLRRGKLQLPAAFAAVEPLDANQQLVSSGLGAWTIRRIESADDMLVVIGSRHVACYDGATMKLRQMCGTQLFSDPSWVEPPWRPAVLGRSWNSAIGGSEALSSGYPAVYNMVMSTRTEALEYDVAAWDAAGGRMLWSTSGRDEWKDLLLQSEPVAGEGCVYALATGRKVQKTLPIFLVCMNGKNGAILWQQELGALPPNSSRRNLAVGGSAITLYEGALYVSSDSGIVACCDARDGAMEWLRAYPNGNADEHSAKQFLREGTAPLISAGKMFAAPRDHTGVIALEAATGLLLWESSQVPSDQLVGVSGQVLVTRGDGGLAALNLTTGKSVWTKTLDDANTPRMIVTDSFVLAAVGDHLIRLLAATGATVDELRLNGGPGSAFALLEDGTLVEFAEEPLPDPVEQPGSVAGPLQLPLSMQWSLACDRPMLIRSPSEGTNTFGVLSGRMLLCVEAQPHGRIVWQSRLPNRPDSVGFHGKLVITALDHTLTALNAATGAAEWALRLPFRADLVGGDERLLFAGEVSGSGRAAAIEPGTGKLLWQQSFGKDGRLAGGLLEWISLSGDTAGSPALHLYWNSAAFGSEGKRPAEVVVDAASGGVREVRRFLQGETQWPPQIAFGDTRSYARLRHLPPWSARGPFMPDTFAYVGDGAKAHFSVLAQGQDLLAGLNLIMDIRPEAQFWSSAGLNPTADGLFVRRLGQLAAFDTNTSGCKAYVLPRNVPARTAFNILDFRQDTGTVMVVSGSGSGIPESTGERHLPNMWDRLQDCTGKGMVAVKCFKGIVQIGHSTLQLPEAGSNPTATLLNGQVEQHFQDSRIWMGNISSLGWSKYDVYLYGFGGTVDIDGIVTQQCASADYGKVINRTTFVPGVNYIKFAGLSGDEFTLNFTQSPFSAIQIVNASQDAAKNKPEGLGINWTGGGPALKPTDVVGAEVSCGNWYNINEYDLISGGLTNSALARAVMSVDIFDRETGLLTSTQELPGSRARAQGAGYADQARLLDGGLLTTDALGVYFMRSHARNISQ